MILGSNEIGAVVLFDIATSGWCCRRWWRRPDADFQVVVVADCGAGRDGPGTADVG